MKYIIIEACGIEMPIVFSELMYHSSIAQDKKVIAAGFCRFGARTILGEDANGSEDSIVADVECWGKSVELKIGSRYKIDADLILEHNKFQC